MAKTPKKRFYSSSDDESDERAESPVASIGIDFVQFHALMEKLEHSKIKITTVAQVAKDITKLVETDPNYADFSVFVKES